MFSTVPSDGQIVPKELDAAKKDNPAAIERIFFMGGFTTAHLAAFPLFRAVCQNRDNLSSGNLGKIS